MATILSLSKARKIKARTARQQQATENRIVFGRTKDEKAKQSADTARAIARIDGHKLSPKDTSDG